MTLFPEWSLSCYFLSTSKRSGTITGGLWCETFVCLDSPLYVCTTDYEWGNNGLFLQLGQLGFNSKYIFPAASPRIAVHASPLLSYDFGNR